MTGLVENAAFGGGLAFAAAVQPGPFQTFLVSRAVSGGRRRALPACAAPLLSDGPIALLAIALVGQIPAAAQHLLRASGGLLLLYLAVPALRGWRAATPSAPVSAPRTVLEAALVNLLNPNPYLAWALVLGPSVLAAWRAHPAHAAALVLSFYATILVTLAAIVLLAGTARLLDANRQRALAGVSALLLAAFGIALLAGGVRGFVESPAGRTATP